MIFTEVSVGLTGSITSTEAMDTEDLRPEAVGVFLELLAEHRTGFVTAVPVRKFDHIQLQWADYLASAAATFTYRDEPVTKALLLSGRTPDTDAVVLRVFERLLGEMLGSRVQLADAARDRPVLIAAAIANPRIDPEDRRAVKVIQRFLAAAYFERLATASDEVLVPWSDTPGPG